MSVGYPARDLLTPHGCARAISERISIFPSRNPVSLLPNQNPDGPRAVVIRIRLGDARYTGTGGLSDLSRPKER